MFLSHVHIEVSISAEKSFYSYNIVVSQVSEIVSLFNKRHLNSNILVPVFLLDGKIATC